MKKLVLAMVIAVFVLASVSLLVAQSAEKKAGAENDHGDLNWHKYDEALQIAAKENKHVLVFFTTTWCGYCKKMKASTFKDAGVINLMNDQFVLAKVDGDSKEALTIKDKTGKMVEVTERELTQSFGIRGYPTTVFLKSDGSSIAPLSGYIDAKNFTTALKYISTDAYEQMSYQEFQQKKG